MKCVERGETVKENRPGDRGNHAGTKPDKCDESPSRNKTPHHQVETGRFASSPPVLPKPGLGFRTPLHIRQFEGFTRLGPRHDQALLVQLIRARKSGFLIENICPVSCAALINDQFKPVRFFRKAPDKSIGFPLKRRRIFQRDCLSK